MKKLIISILALASVLSVAAQKQNAAYLAYIEQWKETAIRQQIDYGVPVSITMAQALLESAAGQSELAVNANNHFGIKCTGDWFGGVYYYDDDRQNECFRQYNDAALSFKDHSLFLKRARYESLWEIAVEDYEGWAYRLKQCGYATDKNYAPKLIKIIEDYRLDTLAKDIASYEPQSGRAHDREEGPMPGGYHQRPQPKEVLSEGSAKKATVVRGTEPIAVITRDPEPPYVEPLSAAQEKENLFLSHPKEKCNGIYYIVAREGDSYANVAFRLNVRERELREHNDALGRMLKPGDRIYLSRKRMYAPQEKAIMWVHPGEKLWDICQREGVQMTVIQELNGFAPSLTSFRTRQQIYLARVKK